MLVVAHLPLTIIAPLMLHLPASPVCLAIAGGTVHCGAPPPPESIELSLDDEGFQFVPDVASLLPSELGRRPWFQFPPPGAVVSGETIVVVRLQRGDLPSDADDAEVVGVVETNEMDETKGSDCHETPHDCSRRELTLRFVDRTPPCIDATQVAGPSMRSPMGIACAVASDATTLEVRAYDAVDPAPSIQLRVNGRPASAPVQLDTPGLVQIDAEATDAAANRSTWSTLVLVRERPLIRANAVVASLEVKRTVGQVSGFSATIVVAASDADLSDLHLGTVQLFPINARGAIIGPPVSPDGIRLCEPDTWTPELQVQIDPGAGNRSLRGAWQLHFHAELTDGSIDEPAGLMLFGRVAPQDPDGGIDVVATMPFAVDPFAPAALAEFMAAEAIEGPGWISGGGGKLPPVTCEWIVMPIIDPHDDPWDWHRSPAICLGPAVVPYFAESRVLVWPPGSARGLARAVDDGCVNPIETFCLVERQMTLNVFLDPVPPCTSCHMTASTRPGINADLTVANDGGAFVAAYVGAELFTHEVIVAAGWKMGNIQGQSVAFEPIRVLLTEEPPPVAHVSKWLETAVEEDSSRCYAGCGLRSGAAVAARADKAPLSVLPTSEGMGWLGTEVTWPMPKLRITGQVLTGPCWGARVDTGIYGAGDDLVPPVDPPW